MEPISLLKRILYYLLLSFISLIMMVICGLGFREYEMIYFYYGIFVFAFLIPHYIFGKNFLKTKLIFKLIVSFIATLVSFGSTLLTHIFDVFEFVFPIVLLLPVILVWEIAYQIVKVKSEKVAEIKIE